MAVPLSLYFSYKIFSPFCIRSGNMWKKGQLHFPNWKNKIWITLAKNDRNAWGLFPPSPLPMSLLWQIPACRANLLSQLSLGSIEEGSTVRIRDKLGCNTWMGTMRQTNYISDPLSYNSSIHTFWWTLVLFQRLRSFIPLPASLYWTVDRLPVYRPCGNWCQFPCLLHYPLHRRSVCLSDLHYFYLWSHRKADSPGRDLSHPHAQSAGPP